VKPNTRCQFKECIWTLLKGFGFLENQSYIFILKKDDSRLWPTIAYQTCEAKGQSLKIWSSSSDWRWQKLQLLSLVKPHLLLLKFVFKPWCNTVQRKNLTLSGPFHFQTLFQSKLGMKCLFLDMSWKVVLVEKTPLAVRVHEGESYTGKGLGVGLPAISKGAEWGRRCNTSFKFQEPSFPTIWSIVLWIKLEGISSTTISFKILPEDNQEWFEKEIEFLHPRIHCTPSRTSSQTKTILLQTWEEFECF